MLNVGIVGMGEIGMTHAVICNALQESRTKAICDKDMLRVRVARKLFPEVTFYTDSERMIAEEDLDLVVVATPTPTHHILVPDVVRANQDVSILVEKPLAVDYTRALELVALQKQSKGVLSVGYQKRFSGTFRRAKDLLQNGAIGELVRFRSSFFTSALTKIQKGWRYETGTGGVTRDFGPHLLDLLLWFFGEPASVKSVKASVYSTEVEDSVHALVRYKSGLEGTLDMSWAIPEYSSQELMVAVEGKEGFLEVTDDRLVVRSGSKPGDALQAISHISYANELSPQVPYLFSEPEFTLQDQYLIDCIRLKKNPEVTFETAAKVNKFIDLILNSTGK